MDKEYEKTEHDQIVYWNRATGKEEVEKVYGDKFVRFLYGTKSGQTLADRVLSKAFLSKAYGWYQSSKASRHKVKPFIKQFQIPMQEYEGAPFRSFNDFFIRKFKEGMRPFVRSAQEMPAFAEARYLGFERISLDQKFPVKGYGLTAEALLGDRMKAKAFEGGPLLLARLCPTDYHRFHFPDRGTVVESYPIKGKLHSVNPMALQYKDEIFMTNERQVSLLQTEHFGKLAFIEVGALCVGRIVQTHFSASFERGEEKGYFLFGGSTVIVLGEPGAWVPASDLLEQTARETETLVRLGECIAIKNVS